MWRRRDPMALRNALRLSFFLLVLLFPSQVVASHIHRSVTLTARPSSFLSSFSLATASWLPSYSSHSSPPPASWVSSPSFASTASLPAISPRPRSSFSSSRVSSFSSSHDRAGRTCLRFCASAASSRFGRPSAESLVSLLSVLLHSPAALQTRNQHQSRDSRQQCFSQPRTPQNCRSSPRLAELSTAVHASPHASPQTSAHQCRQLENESEAFGRLVCLLREAGAFIADESLALGPSSVFDFRDSSFVSAERGGSFPAAAQQPEKALTPRDATEQNSQLRGLFARRHFHRGEVIAAIPRRLHFSEKNVLAWLAQREEAPSVGVRKEREERGPSSASVLNSRREGDGSPFLSSFSDLSLEKGRCPDSRSEGAEASPRTAFHPGASRNSQDEKDRNKTFLFNFFNDLLDSDSLVDDPQMRLAVVLLFFRFLAPSSSTAWAPSLSTSTSPASSFFVSPPPSLSPGVCSSASETERGDTGAADSLSQIWRLFVSLCPRDLRHLLPLWELTALRTLEHRIVNVVLKRLYSYQCVADAVDRILSSPASPPPPHGVSPKEDMIWGRQEIRSRLKESFDVEQLKWAACVVSSRSFRVGGETSLVPLLDFLNCGGRGDAAANAKVTRREKKHVFQRTEKTSGATEDQAFSEEDVSIIAARDIRAGEEILISYGEDNDKRLLNYGFFDASPREEKTTLFFSAALVRAALAATDVPDLLLLSGFGGLPPRQSAALKKLQLIPNPARPAASPFSPLVTVFAAEPLVEGRLLAAARVLMLDEDSLGNDEIDVEKAASWNTPFSADNERRACTFLVSLLRHDHHRSHSSSLEEDAEILKTRRFPTGEVEFGKAPFEPLTASREVALRFRMHRKRVLREAIARLQIRCQSIREDSLEMEQGTQGQSRSTQYMSSL
ncbi:putative histone lysine methyltransferase, SET [Toxoplasma gondii TgCatPRC2]|uniref:Histone lysine methyltransferase, SET, putative n=4 Tax=Toxoplasma gondii TaxID=5811 RepID=A0A125YKU3_TOXGM|nr:histone lysine methyltransferase, SET, putative [Toxoplasma gondii ME49]EPR58145.1 putative histone lysine methyltransferase, SET [Toxoplasma gondii GT1]EPT31517.1 histone lysine methyltransferase, SET, putative [Toxoplasma gondii ME49]KAF4644929.1 putative histone lysine methyltransferase, SET [Toxoplasma gondii]KYK66853.1 putative histone lysine methyltransferase, SET [Toxoplasma gondii TgCatPRC2]|eukprot:XP_018638037.1 histone lysine methyltransferase, SET, putative [Toxoplasma gondii ME49]